MAASASLSGPRKAGLRSQRVLYRGLPEPRDAQLLAAAAAAPGIDPKWDLRAVLAARSTGHAARRLAVRRQGPFEPGPLRMTSQLKREVNAARRAARQAVGF